jgi:malic enzyme
MSAVLSRWPGCVIQFEDFETKKAEPLLKKYRELRVFNDDIQVP